MPTILKFKEWALKFYSNEGNPREPVHIHAIARDGREAKFELLPSVVLKKNIRCSDTEIALLTKLVKANRDLLVEAWNEYFTD